MLYSTTIPSVISDVTNCGYVRITDDTRYANNPLVLEETRQSYAILVLVDTSALGVTYVNEPTYTQLDNPSFPTAWNIDIPNITYYYKIKAYWCTIVTQVVTPLLADTVVFNSTDSTFYTFDVGTGIYTPLDAVSDWSAYCDANTTVYQREDILYYEKTTSYVITKAACHKYYICDRSNNDADKIWNIYGTTGNRSAPLLSGTFDPTTDNPYLLDITTLGDGVYIVEIDDGSNIFNYPIYDFCTTEICMESLMRDILCTDTQCVETCDNDFIVVDRNKRDSLNQMLALYLFMIGKINAERLEYLNIFTIESDRIAVLQEVDNVITKFKELMVRCGVCNEVDTTTTTTIEPPCQTC